METSSVGRPTFGGIASGLDTSALLEGLLAIERQPLQRIEQQRAEVNNERSLVRDLNTRLLALRTAAQQLDNRNSTGSDFSTTEEFLRYTGSSSDDEIVGVSATSGAAPGDIEVTINQLARGSREFSSSFTETGSRTALATGQSVSISLNNADPDAAPPVAATEITVTAEGGALSLTDIRDQINTSLDNGGNVRADILRTSDDDLRLVLSSTDGGSENQLTITGDLPIDAGLREEAQNAQFEVFGQPIERTSNVVDDVLTGITLRLESLSEFVTEGDPDSGRRAETVTVAVDADEVAANLEEFTTAFNDVVGFLDRQFRFDEGSGESGPLSGDSTLRRIQSQLRSFVSQGFAFPANPFASGEQGGVISNVGIEIEPGGRLSVDRERLDEALAQDALAVREFFSGRVNTSGGEDSFTNGFAELFATELEELVRSGDGTLAQRDRAYADRLNTFDDSIDRFSRRISLREETLIQRFSELERIVAGLQSQQGFLGGL